MIVYYQAMSLWIWVRELILKKLEWQAPSQLKTLSSIYFTTFKMIGQILTTSKLMQSRLLSP